MIKIIVDAMGGDNAPGPQIEGSVRAAQELGVEIVLVGQEKLIHEHLGRLGYEGDAISIVNATEVITNNDEPAKALRSKKDSSIVVAANLLKHGEGDGLVSAGATGGVLSAGLLIVGRIPGVSRPALAPIIPTDQGPALLVDAGANSECKPENLLQFGVMGSIYAQNVLGKESPKVAIVNIGEEEHKGNALTKEAYELLKAAPIRFTGNIEGREIPAGDADVIVCDGFVGNVILKLTEGLAQTLMGNIKQVFKKNVVSMMAAALIKGGLKDLKKKMDYTEYGGALLLGTKAPVIKGHGSSNAKAMFSAIRQAKLFIETDVVTKIKTQLSQMEGQNHATEG